MLSPAQLAICKQHETVINCIIFLAWKISKSSNWAAFKDGKILLGPQVCFGCLVKEAQENLMKKIGPMVEEEAVVLELEVEARMWM